MPHVWTTTFHQPLVDRGSLLLDCRGYKAVARVARGQSSALIPILLVFHVWFLLMASIRTRTSALISDSGSGRSRLNCIVPVASV